MYNFIAFLLMNNCILTFAGLSSKWDSCGCYWEKWEPWSACTRTCGGGMQKRERSVWSDDRPGCDDFTDCASGDMGQEHRSCNDICYNGGSIQSLFSFLQYCNCPRGTTGSCCEQIIDCGQPSSISHGSYTGNNFTYGNIIHYTCDTDYNITEPSDTTRTCTNTASWSGQLPQCLFAVSCNSNPCQNNGTCTNLLGDYKCECELGWSGKNCEVDVQPPVMQGCPHNVTIHTSNMTSVQSWTEPTFYDPHGTKIRITKNYQTSTFEFPWGEHTVQFTALKPSNGLQTECIFTIAIKPHPCEEMEAPEHGLVACNGWMADYSRACKFACMDGFSLPPGYNSETIYNCGATGHWFPSDPVHECIPDEIRFNVPSKKQVSFTTCNSQSGKQEIAEFYLRELKSSTLYSLCNKNTDDCTAENVEIKC